MKKVTILLAFGGLLMCPNMYAQQENKVSKTKVEAHHEKSDKEMAKELNLTAEQKKEMKIIKEKYADKEQSLQQELKALRQAKREEMKAVLTPQQQEKAKAVHKKRMKRHKTKKQLRRHKQQQRIEPKND